MQRLRVSFTLLQLWRSSRFEDAVRFYKKEPLPITSAMQAGIDFENTVYDYIRLHKALPSNIGGDTLVNPQMQVKKVMDLNSEIELVGVFDIVDTDTLFELKSGNSKDSADYATDFQVSIYLLLAPETVEKAYIVHWNQYTHTHDRSLIWNTPEERERGRNFIESISPDIREYFLSIGLLDS